MPASTERRQVPRSFSLHWGSGQIVEEASVTGEHHEPAIQLLEYDDGSVSIRFAWYDHKGRFQRSPLIVGEQELEELRHALRDSPRLRQLLRRLAD